MADDKYRVNYEHTNTSGGTTTGFRDIFADSKSEALEKFNQMNSGRQDTYKPTNIERR